MHVGFRFDYTSGEKDRSGAVPEPTDLEDLWRSLLSGKPTLIRAAWEMLDAEERASVRLHLQAMSRDAGWQDGQRRAARSALHCVSDNPPGRGTDTAPAPSARRKGK
jgi:hypothetical protein